jgi:hypothetical protein
MNSISETPSIDLNQLARFPTRSLFARDGLFVVICAAKHPAGSGVYVVHLSASDALHRGKSCIIVRSSAVARAEPPSPGESDRGTVLDHDQLRTLVAGY